MTHAKGFRDAMDSCTSSIMKILGIILIVVGLIALAFPYVNITREKKILDIGPIEAVSKEKESYPISPLIGIAGIVAGTVIVVAGTRKKG